MPVNNKRMEIEFNTGRIPQAESSQPVARRGATRPTPDTTSFSASDSLKSQLNTISTVRPEAVAKGQALVSDGSYPPDYVLNRIATLLAIHSKADLSNQSGSAS